MFFHELALKMQERGVAVEGGGIEKLRFSLVNNLQYLN